MNVPLVEAQTRLPELIEQALSGKIITIELDDGSLIQLDVVRGEAKPFNPEQRRRALERIAASGARNALPGPCAARSQDFLYDDETGLPA